MSAYGIAVFILGTAGLYMVLGRGRFGVILGLSLLAHGANLVVLAVTAVPGAEPALHGSGAAMEEMADPLPQAMVLTAIVISMALTFYLLVLLVADRGDAGGEDEV